MPVLQDDTTSILIKDFIHEKNSLSEFLNTSRLAGLPDLQLRLHVRVSCMGGLPAYVSN